MGMSSTPGHLVAGDMVLRNRRVSQAKSSAQCKVF